MIDTLVVSGEGRSLSVLMAGTDSIVGSLYLFITWACARARRFERNSIR
jgi:hypothetical protein